ncbi:carbohydrate kinase [Sphaerisporangium sp. TRM90804]|uniref:carbohydrate kinase family protein n=1 Tax=Sphaerisporangium sp. TRM90804 TaxID=3031113 RepID=UPI00244D27F3|nr:carbohydrate kinase [Sphaerisporangium sp. TRM90804]MDH2430731.1 carbohydrate kinase [Sphaerisporangium sp. TRM90804]
MPYRPVAVLGECVADAVVVPADGPSELTLRVLPGGGPANTATALARLGTPTRFLARVSGDRFGALFREHLSASGVDLSRCVAAVEPSTLAVADLDADGRATYSFHAEGAADWGWSRDELDPERLGAAGCLHTGSLALARDPGGPLVEELLARVRPRVTVSLDPNVRTALVRPDVYRDRFPRWCALADLVRMSDEDLNHLAPGASIPEACDTCHERGVRLVVVTQGAGGATASLDGHRLSVPAPVTAVADTIGAGDAFTAGLLHRLGALSLLGGRLTDLTPSHVHDALSFATQVAALTCATAGANPPWPHQLPPPA